MPEPQGYTFDKYGMQRAVKAIKRVEAGYPGVNAGSLADSGNAIILAKLTSRDSTDNRLYAWTEARVTAAYYETIHQGLEGKISVVGPPAVDAKVPALDITEDASREDLTNAYVLLCRSFYMKPQLVSDGGSGHTTKVLPAPCFIVVGYPPGKGQYQFMVDQMVAQNQRGWAMVKAHPATI